MFIKVLIYIFYISPPFSYAYNLITIAILASSNSQNNSNSIGIELVAIIAAIMGALLSVCCICCALCVRYCYKKRKAQQRAAEEQAETYGTSSGIHPRPSLFGSPGSSLAMAAAATVASSSSSPTSSAATVERSESPPKNPLIKNSYIYKNNQLSLEPTMPPLHMLYQNQNINEEEKVSGMHYDTNDTFVMNQSDITIRRDSQQSQTSPHALHILRQRQRDPLHILTRRESLDSPVHQNNNDNISVMDGKLSQDDIAVGNYSKETVVNLSDILQDESIPSIEIPHDESSLAEGNFNIEDNEHDEHATVINVIQSARYHDDSEVHDDAMSNDTVGNSTVDAENIIMNEFISPLSKDY